MRLPMKFPPINLLQEVEVRLVDSRESVSPRMASREQCDCDCACSLAGSTVDQVALSLPTAFYLELTSWCPNRCAGCGNVFIDRRLRQRNPAEMRWEQWQTVLEIVVESATLIKLTGGEPTQSPHFYRIVDFLEDHRVPFAVLTSGLWSNPGKLLSVLSSKKQFQGFLISLHGSCDTQHELFTQNAGSYSRAIQSIRQAAEAGMDVSVSTILLQSNLGHLQEIADTALEHGAKNIIFARQIGEPLPGITLDESELRLAVEEVTALEHQGYPVKIGNCIPQCFDANPSRGCTAGLTFCTVDPTGNLRPCNHSKVVAGNLLVQPLEALWNSPELQDWRTMQSPTCNSCPSHARCGGGCKVMYEQGRDTLMTSPESAGRETRLPKVEVSLFRFAVPSPKYIQKTDRMGNILLGKGMVIPIGHDVEMFLEDTIKKRNLAEIEQTYGSPALAFIANLHSLGLVELL
jgi:radical SAM protein with 4Fe4S-binding SPASM domain